MPDLQNNRFGFIPGGVPNSATFALDAAAERHAMSFIASSTAKTIIEVAHYLSAVAGVLLSSDIKCELQADLDGNPSTTALETVNCNQTPSGAGIHTWALNTVLTAGARYWPVWKNTNAVPGTNFPTFRWGGSNSNPAAGTGDATVGWSRRMSTDSGATWASTPTAACTGLRVGYSDGSYDGYPFHNQGASASGLGIYSGRELGSIFTTPSDATLRVRGLRFLLTTKTGTPTGTLRARLYEGTSLLATSVNFYNTVPTTSAYDFLFASTLTLTPNVAHRAVVGETTQSDASTNRYNAREYVVFDDAPSRALMPFLGTMQLTYWNESTWAETNTSIIPMELILDSADPFAAGSSGGLLVHSGMSGGLRG